MKREIADIRRDYMLKSLDEADALLHPIDQFTIWWNEAVTSDIDEVNAFTLATIDTQGMPDARIVLLKSYDEDGFVFFTNYNSQKGAQLAANPKACMVFFWKELERQVRIQGAVQKIDAAASDAYYHSRPLGSRIGAWASNQSAIINDRTILEHRVNELMQQFGDHPPRPEHWGGYIIQPQVIEFWQGRSSRLHDRLRYTLTNQTDWLRERLSP
ncbi:MAG TPA: pyridoxamine 5'-phosphate oxidase [Chitinophagaceae bacterium]|nr:pyridoxamine 5'-phosphate oxidase [Chitinophagaceae bacterium]